MKIAILGGTGKMGQGLATRLAGRHEVLIASRDPARAKSAAERIRGAVGMDYRSASRACEACVAAVPYAAIGSLAPLADDLAGKLVISMINPMKIRGGILSYGLERGSAAEELAATLPKSRVAAAFNNVPAAFFKAAEAPLLDVVVAADAEETYEMAASIVKSIGNLRPMYGGSLSEAQTVERITPLLLNLARLNGMGSLATRFVSRDG